ncbi:MAG: WG repeat-containing protein [Flavobacteriales bacterium]|nr:WG repeat-containing protein [Flavobacteriales bacterium]
MRNLLFATWTLAALTGCTSRHVDHAQQEGTHSVVDTPAMSYAKVHPANAEGFAKVSRGDGETCAEGIIDAKGVEIIPPRTSMLVDDISGYTALVRNGREHLFVDLGNGPVDTNLFTTTKGYQYAEPFRCGRAMVQVDDRRFYIDIEGNQLFDATYDHAETFHHDRAMVKEGEHYRIIDTEGKTVARMTYDQVSPQSPWCWQVTRINDDMYWSGFVDLNGKELTPLVYDEVGYYDPEVKRIRVGKGDKFGFLDEHAREVIPVQYEYAEIFDKGKARVMLNGRELFIDPDGKEVAE